MEQRYKPYSIRVYIRTNKEQYVQILLVTLNYSILDFGRL